MWVSCLEELSTDHTLRIQNIIQLLPRDVSSRQTGSQTATRTPVGSPVGSRDWGHSSVGTVHVQHGQDSELCSLPRATESQAPWNMPQILLLGVEAGDSEVQVILCHMVSLRTAWRSWATGDPISKERKEGKGKSIGPILKTPKSEIQETNSLSLNKSPKHANALKLWKLLISTSVMVGPWRVARS